LKYKPEQLIVALDLAKTGPAMDLVERLSPLGVSFKVGLELYMAGGSKFVSGLVSRGPIFLDLKFHDIPNTAAAAVKKAASLGVSMLNVHASGGREMMMAAREAIEGFDKRPILLAVTVLTSMSERHLLETGCSGSAEEKVNLLASLAAECGLDGVVCSPLEIGSVKKGVSEKFITVTPGIRPAGEKVDDQSRVAAPADVARAGGDYLVVGRPITRAQDPEAATRAILAEMGV
jgi:orotidine-5'-phosphate decarboxylase